VSWLRQNLVLPWVDAALSLASAQPVSVLAELLLAFRSKHPIAEARARKEARLRRLECSRALFPNSVCGLVAAFLGGQSIGWE
jgi:hypothetical protein